MIEVHNLQKEYVDEETPTRALCGVTFSVEKGEFISIMGPSGSGKSTLMHILGFLDTASGGVYHFDGRDVTNYDEDELADIRSRKVGVVFQAFNLLPKTSALDNVRLPLIYQGVGAGEQKKRAEEALTRVGLEHRMAHKPNELSGGQQQRVAVARALITNPLLILADEPTGNLDVKNSGMVFDLLTRLAKDNCQAVILVTHNPEIAQRCDVTRPMRDGLFV